MPKLKLGTLVPTPEEDAVITAAAMDDLDAPPISDADWHAIKPSVRVGRPPSTAPHKVQTTIRLDADVLEQLRASGKGWQTRANDALREWLRRQ